MSKLIDRLMAQANRESNELYRLIKLDRLAKEAA